MAARDYHEVVTYSFVEAAWEADFSATHAEGAAPIVLANPIASQMGVMRSTLIGGLVGDSGYQSQAADRARTHFRNGALFSARSGCGPGRRLYPAAAAGRSGGRSGPAGAMGSARQPVDFYDIKADVEALFAPRRLEFVKTAHPALHPGRCASVVLDGSTVGVLGELHPRWVQKYELGTAPVVFELELTELLAASFPAYTEVSRFPAVVRDLALVVPQSQDLAPLLEALRTAAPVIVRDVALFDVYHGKGLA